MKLFSRCPVPRNFYNISQRNLSINRELQMSKTTECDEHGTSRLIQGAINHKSDCIAIYYISWQPDHAEDAIMDLVIGSYGNDNKDKKYAIRLIEKVVDGNIQTAVIDQDNQDIQQLASHLLRRDQVIGTPLAKAVFDIVDTIFLKDPRVIDKELDMCKYAASQGCVASQVKVGLLYFEGRTVDNKSIISIDNNKSFHYFKMAAERQHPSALLYLGVHYDKGLGVEADEAIARNYLNLARSGGEEEAQNYLNYMDTRSQDSPSP